MNGFSGLGCEAGMPSPDGGPRFTGPRFLTFIWARLSKLHTELHLIAHGVSSHEWHVVVSVIALLSVVAYTESKESYTPRPMHASPESLPSTCTERVFGPSPCLATSSRDNATPYLHV